MNGREKIEAAFSPEGTSEFGAVICYEHIYSRDHWSAVTGCPWWEQFSPEIRAAYAWRERVARQLNQDWVHLPSCPSHAYRHTHRITRHGGRVFLRGDDGQENELFEPSIGGWELFDRGMSGHVDEPANTPGEVDVLVGEPAAFDKAAFVRAGHADLAKKMLSGFASALYPIEHVSAPLWGCYSLWGFERMMELIARNPRLVRHACDRFLAHELVSVRRAAAVGVKGIWIEDCLTDMIHPRAFAALHLPDIRALAEEIHAQGMHSIHYFCGNPAGKLEMLLTSGVDALSLEESKKGFIINIAEVAEASHGRVALLGNLDAITLLPNAGEDDLHAEIARQVRAGRGNRSRFVMSVGSPITPGTTPERTRRFIDMAHELGRG